MAARRRPKRKKRMRKRVYTKRMRKTKVKIKRKGIAKGKKWKSTVVINGKKHTVSHGDPNYKIAPGTKRAKSYCARARGIMRKYGRTPRNIASMRKWHCSIK